MDVNRIYGVNTERVQPLHRAQKVNLPSFEYMREDIAKHYSNQTEQRKKPKNREHFLRQNYEHSRFQQTIQPYGFKENTLIAMENCIYVDHITVKQMITYAANHDDFFWDDMGFDGNAKWIVVKGQRFECRFNDDEIACYEQMFEGTPYTRYLVRNQEREARMHILVKLNHQGQLQFIRLGNPAEHKKIQTLQRNIHVCTFIQKVMRCYHLREMIFML